MNKISMKKPSAVFLCLLLLAPTGYPAELPGWLRSPYVEHPVAPVDLTNSPRIRQLLRSGNIYLSLSDAIALAIENNLDIQLERYTLPSADTEVLRAKGGGLLRGLTYNVFEVPVGVGGPASPLVTAAASLGVGAAGSVPTNPSELGALSEQQDNLSQPRPFLFQPVPRFHSSIPRSRANSIGRTPPPPIPIRWPSAQMHSPATRPTPMPVTRKDSVRVRK